MKIRFGTLRKLLAEVTVGPSVFKNNRPSKGALENKNVSKAVNDLEASFKRALELDLVISMSNEYDQESHEFDDNAYERVKKATASSAEHVLAVLNDAMEKTWAKAHEAVKSDEQERHPQTSAGAPS